MTRQQFSYDPLNAVPFRLDDAEETIVVNRYRTARRGDQVAYRAIDAVLLGREAGDTNKPFIWMMLDISNLHRRPPLRELHVLHAATRFATTVKPP
jgi:hypothetical protein